MTLNLPPERPLPGSGAMIDSIVDGVVPAQPDPAAGRMPWRRLAVAAVAVLAVGGIAFAISNVLGRDVVAPAISPSPITPTVTTESADPTPTTPAPATTPPTDPPTRSAEPPGATRPTSPEPPPTPEATRPGGPVSVTLDVGETAHTTYFDVTVLNSEGHPDATGMGVLVRVCYAAAHPDANDDGTTRTSTDPWSFGVYDGEGGTIDDVEFVRVDEFPPSSHWSPTYETRLLRVGECNEGWIQVSDGNPDLARPYIRYSPQDFGDDIRWNLDFS